MRPHERERQQRRKYWEAMAAKREAAANEIRTMEMLLDARWVPENNHFVKVGHTAEGYPKYYYYNRRGEVIYKSPSMYDTYRR